MSCKFAISNLFCSRKSSLLVFLLQVNTEREKSQYKTAHQFHCSVLSRALLLSCHLSPLPPSLLNQFKNLSVVTKIVTNSKINLPSFENTEKIMMTNGRKTSPEAGIQLPDTKVAEENGRMLISCGKVGRNVELLHMVLRVVCFSTSLTAVLVMATAEQRSTMSLFGFNLPLYSKWSFSDSFEYLVAVSAVVAVHSLLQLLITASRLLQNPHLISSKNHAWVIFAADQIFAYAMMSAGSAACGVTNLNRTGIKHSSLPNFCKPLHAFCNRVAVSIAFTFLSCFLLAASSVLDVLWVANSSTQP